ncbi:MAG TPA: transposase [Vicinamibacterales bacterium]|nr:transposase [Vicinamibacterales bacterium]
MARQPRIQFPGAVYHVMSRGNARQKIFLDEDDCATFLRLLRHVRDRMDWQMWAYCLMPNHYHLLLETPAANLSKGMHDLNGAYSVAFNDRHARVGHVFQGRFKALLVDKDRYLIALARYLVLNPVRAQLCEAPGSWRWSSYRATTGGSDVVMRRVDTFRILRLFGSEPDQARLKYRDFVAAGVGKPLDASAGPNRSILGDELFVGSLEGVMSPTSTEVSRADRVQKTLPEYGRHGPTRNAAMRAAYASGAFSLRAIAAHFGVHYSTASRIVRAGSTSIQDATP